MNSTKTNASIAQNPPSNIVGFIKRCLIIATEGSIPFYAWMIFLTVLILVGLNTYAHQIANGLGVSNMTDQVSWGMYISNFTYFVGLAAGAVMMVIPAYLYKRKEMHQVVIIGEILAVAAIIMSVSFVVADLGRPERMWHMFPMLGVLNWPDSLLTWDVFVLSIYLLLNFYVVTYIMYCRFLQRIPDPQKYMPVVFFSIIWAVSIHTVTAFLYSGLGGRPFWNTAVLAPRFIASAFVTGPAFLVIALQLIKVLTPFPVPDDAISTLLKIMRITILLNLFLFLVEIFTEFYTGGTHTDAARYLYVGLHGHFELVKWIWPAIVLNFLSAVLIFWAIKKPGSTIISLVCLFSLIGIWIEKGMGLIVPGFVPSSLHELIPYTPNAVEWKITVAIWALGLLIFTVGVKTVIALASDPIASQKEEV